MSEGSEPIGQVPRAVLISENPQNKNVLLNRFWFRDVLGQKNLPNKTFVECKSSSEKKSLMIDTFKDTVEGLADELEIRSIKFKKGETIADLPASNIRLFASEFIADENNTLVIWEKKTVEDWLKNITQTEAENPIPAQLNQLRGSKERLYMWLLSRQTRKYGGGNEAFDYLPAEAKVLKKLNCSLATAVGIVLGQKAGVECEQLSVPGLGHVIMGVRAKDGELRGFDMNNFASQIYLKEGKGLQGLPNYDLAESVENKDYPYTHIIRQPDEAMVETILGNTSYYINNESKIALEGDKLKRKELIQTYGADFFYDMKTELFGETHPYYFSPEYKKEREKEAITPQS